MHIDVYCTGSDIDTSNSSNSSSSCSPRVSDQQVFDTDKLLLKHKRVAGHNELPRKLTPMFSGNSFKHFKINFICCLIKKNYIYFRKS